MRTHIRKSLRIGLDAVPIGYPPSGVRVYVEMLIDAFRSGDYDIEAIPLIASTGVSGKSNRAARLYWDIRGIEQAAKSAEIDLLHMTRFAAPYKSGGPLVATVHDLIPLQVPAYRRSRAARIQAEIARRTVSKATRVIVPTQYVAATMTELLGIPVERIDVIPMGVDIPAPISSPAPLSGRYLLHAGGFDVRKNLPMLLRAFARAIPDLEPDWRLVLLGAPHSGNTTVYPPLGPEIERLGLTDRIVMTGRVAESDKQLFFHYAAITVTPSLHEGFGLPILEAMAQGIPVIASNRTSHPEVAGDAALLVEPNEDAFAEAIVRLASNPELSADLSERGRARATEFPWSRTAMSTAETYRKALEQ